MRLALALGRHIFSCLFCQFPQQKKWAGLKCRRLQYPQWKNVVQLMLRVLLSDPHQATGVWRTKSASSHREQGKAASSADSRSVSKWEWGEIGCSWLHLLVTTHHLLLTPRPPKRSKSIHQPLKRLSEVAKVEYFRAREVFVNTNTKPHLPLQFNNLFSNTKMTDCASKSLKTLLVWLSTGEKRNSFTSSLKNLPW